MFAGPPVRLRSHGLNEGKTYHYAGFVELEGVRYLGQSVLFVERRHLDPVRDFLRSNGVEHVISEATMGRILQD